MKLNSHLLFCLLITGTDPVAARTIRDTTWTLNNDIARMSMTADPREQAVFAEFALRVALANVRSFNTRPVVVDVGVSPTARGLALDAALPLVANMAKPVFCGVQAGTGSPRIACYSGQGERSVTERVEARAMWLLGIIGKLGADADSAQIEIRAGEWSAVTTRAALSRWLRQYYLITSRPRVEPGASVGREGVIATIIFEPLDAGNATPSDRQRSY